MANQSSYSPDSKCPYWLSDNSEECKMFNNGGVYIPMPEHISIYCLSSQHFRCQQFIKGDKLLTLQENEDAVMNERRKFRRFAQQVYLTLSVCDIMSKPSKINGFKARTLDVSLGGLRIESPQELPTGSFVSFELDKDTSPQGIAGVGLVMWCKPSKKIDNFEFGIAFPDCKTTHLMRDYIVNSVLSTPGSMRNN